MLIPKKIEKDFIYSLIFGEQNKIKKIISSKEINYERILSIVGSHRIEYLILNKLDDFSLFEDLPEDFLKKLKKNYALKSIFTLKIIEKVFLLSDKLLKSNIEHVFLKGISLHDQNKIYFRPMRDIDLLVNPKDIPKVIDLDRKSVV